MRLEQAAFHFRDGIFWLAYRYSGGGKEEIAYTEGWDFKKEQGAERYSGLRKVLNNSFGVDPKNLFGITQMGGVSFGARFLGCKQVFIDSRGFPRADKAIFTDFFHTYGLEFKEVDAPEESHESINARWEVPMGGNIEADKEPGGARALSVMSAGIALVPVESE